MGPERASSASVVFAPASRPTTRRPRARSASSADGNDGTEQSCACSTAPALARNVAGLSGAGAVLRPDHGIRTERHRAAEDRAEVLRVLDRVEDDDERGIAQDDLVEGLDAQGRGVGDDALMAHAVREAIELDAANARDVRAAVSREAHDRVELRRGRLLHENTQVGGV